VVSGRGQQQRIRRSGTKRAGPYKHLMTGVSFMLPFVVAGGSADRWPRWAAFTPMTMRLRGRWPMRCS
jgi:hypothetical protein